MNTAPISAGKRPGSNPRLGRELRSTSRVMRRHKFSNCVGELLSAHERIRSRRRGHQVKSKGSKALASETAVDSFVIYILATPLMPSMFAETLASSSVPVPPLVSAYFYPLSAYIIIRLVRCSSSISSFNLSNAPFYFSLL